MATGEAAGAAAALAIAAGVDPPDLSVADLQVHLASAGAVVSVA
jgi:hypothetical protein